MFWHIVLIILLVLLAIFVLLGLIALIKKPSSVYKNQPDQKNPVEGKKVIFIEDNSGWEVVVRNQLKFLAFRTKLKQSLWIGRDPEIAVL